MKRRDEFHAVVETGTVRRWTDAVGVEHALTGEVDVRPDGVPGRAVLHAKGDLAPLLEQESRVVLRLRSTGGALEVVGSGFPMPERTAKPTAQASRHAAVLLHTVPFDQETSAVLAKGLDLFLSDPKLSSRYDGPTVDAAARIRDALDRVAR